MRKEESSNSTNEKESCKEKDRANAGEWNFLNLFGIFRYGIGKSRENPIIINRSHTNNYQMLAIS